MVASRGSAFTVGRYSDAIVTAMEMRGREVAPLFPPDPAGNPDELPNTIS